MVKIKVSSKIKVREGDKEKTIDGAVYHIECDRMAAVIVKKGQCALTLTNIALTEAIGAITGAIRDARRSDIYQNGHGWSKGSNSDESFDLVTAVDIGNGKTNDNTQSDIQRGVLLVKQKGQYEIVPLNIEYDDAIGSMELTKMIQLINTSITGAMASAMHGPSLPGRGLPLNIPGIGGDPRRRI